MIMKSNIPNPNCSQDRYESNSKGLFSGSLISRQLQEEQIVNELRNQGHTCIKIMETFPSRHKWCEHNPCIESEII